MFAENLSRSSVYRVLLMPLILLVFPIASIAGIDVTEEKARKVYIETTEAVKKLDFGVLKKYMSPDTEIFIISGENQTEQQISYNEFFEDLEEGKARIRYIEGAEKIISITIDKLAQKATLVAAEQSIFTIDDIKFNSSATRTIVYGLVESEIKIISSRTKFISFDIE